MDHDTTTRLKSWAESAINLVAVAGGRATADLVIQNCQLGNVTTRDILEDSQIATDH